MDGGRFLEGKLAVVTGGTRGIGRAIAQALLDEGANVAICGRTAEACQRASNALVSSGGLCIGMACDVSKPDQVRKFFAFVDEHLGGIDILVNNAGVATVKPVSDMSVEEWDEVIGTNLSGVFYCCREAIPRMRQRGGGSIINISSLAGKNPFAGGAAYNASKFGLNGFSEAMMLDHRHEGIRVSYVMPGSVSTEFMSGPAEWKIGAAEIAEIVLSILRLPERTLVSRVEVRPSRPKR
ncbi:MAG: SDR family oxidoreductase [bacterium]|jgi:3-oxoacyl-[acyl-carrier protein] reductase